MTRRLFAFLLFSLAIAGMPARAAVYLATFSGTASGGWDYTGEFGANGSLFGLPFTATFRLTVPTPGALTSNDGTTATIKGGTENTPDAPSPVSASVTINGVTRYIGGDYRSLATRTNGYTGPGTGTDLLQFEASDYHEQGFLASTRYLFFRLESSVRNLFDTIDPSAPLVYDVQPGDIPYAFVTIEDLNYDPDSSGVPTVSATAGLAFDRLTIAAVPEAVPEPATWLSMILGFLAIGTVLRRRGDRALPAA